MALKTVSIPLHKFCGAGELMLTLSHIISDQYLRYTTVCSNIIFEFINLFTFRRVWFSNEILIKLRSELH